VIAMPPLSRRRFLQLSAAGCAALAGGRSGAAATPARSAMLSRAIPSSGEKLPVIGLGTWQTFDVGAGAAERQPLAEVLRRFFAGGARVIDSSPMYGRAESVLGDLLAAAPPASPPFLATKVWTAGREAGEVQMRESMQKLRTQRVDLMQVHNLVDWKTHLPTLRRWREEGRIRYLGITHYSLGAFAELESILRSEQIDFIQLPYSVGVRQADARLLPAAAERRTAVLVMRPFEEGAVFARVRGQPLPPWAAEIDCQSWSEVFLKFILGHPAVTCVLPATSKPQHLAENLRAGSGRLPDPALRKKIISAVRA
jgi:diketogulonate reductase-like aldo/keto reductase